MFEEIDKDLYEGRGSGGGILQGLQDECQQWATRFPHLRYLIRRLLSSASPFLNSQWNGAAVGSKTNYDCGEKPVKVFHSSTESHLFYIFIVCVCHSVSWGLSCCVPVMKASSGILPQGKAALPAGCQRAKKAALNPRRKTGKEQSKSQSLNSALSRYIRLEITCCISLRYTKISLRVWVVSHHLI